MAQGEKRSFWDRLFGRNQPSAREERVVEYIIHRLGEGAHLGDVRRNASPLEIEEICADPRLVEAARQHLRQDFDSGELDPGKRPR
jgi:hypothetical protein